jgi:hypothetical protein
VSNGGKRDMPKGQVESKNALYSAKNEFYIVHVSVKNITRKGSILRPKLRKKRRKS